MVTSVLSIPTSLKCFVADDSPRHILHERTDMAPNSHFSSSVGDPFIDSLRQRLERMAIAVMHLEENIVLPVREDPRLVRKYLYLYTLPILEIAGLLGAEPSKLGLWANVHMSLSLHLRAIDYVLDGDSDRGQVTDQARRAYLY